MISADEFELERSKRKAEKLTQVPKCDEDRVSIFAFKDKYSDLLCMRKARSGIYIQH